MPHRLAVSATFLAGAACVSATATGPVHQAVAGASQVKSRSSGSEVILPPGGGDQLFFCDTPHLDVTVKVGSAQNSASMEMGTARLATGTNNFGRHEVDEIIYFTKGRGFATVGDERTAVQPGSSMFVPRGVRHGFENTGPDLMEFVWITSPPGFEKGIREVGIPSLTQCRQKP